MFVRNWTNDQEMSLFEFVLSFSTRRIASWDGDTQLRHHLRQLFPSLSLIFLLRRSLAVSILTSGSCPPLSCFSKPKTCPTNPPGFGTGHSLLLSRTISVGTCS